MSFQSIIQVLKGGPTSGNFGHSGRPGKWGGSAPGGGHGAVGIKPGSVSDVQSYRQSRGNPVEYISGPQAEDKLVAHAGIFDLDEKMMDSDPGYHSSITDYGNGDFEGVNGLLRSGNYDKVEPKWMGTADQNSKYAAEEMTKFINAAPRTPVGVITYRQVDVNFLKKLRLKPGDEFTDNAFTSTAMVKHKSGSVINPDVYTPDIDARGFINISLPKGSKAVPMRGLVPDKYDQHELLLQRGTTFRVTKITNHADGRIEVDVEANTNG